MDRRSIIKNAGIAGVLAAFTAGLASAAGAREHGHDDLPRSVLDARHDLRVAR